MVIPISIVAYNGIVGNRVALEKVYRIALVELVLVREERLVLPVVEKRMK